MHAYEVSGRGCRISRVRNNIQHTNEVSGRDCTILRLRKNRSNMPSKYQAGAAGFHMFETTDPTCLRGIRTGLHDLTGLEQRIQHAYEVSGLGCTISRVKNNSLFQHAYKESGLGCTISRVKNNTANIHTRYRDGTTGSHGLGTTVPACIRGIKTGLQNLMFKPDRTYLQGIRTGLQDLTGSEHHQIVHAYRISGRGCRISRLSKIRSNMPSMYQNEATGSHVFRTPDRTCLRGNRTGLQDITRSEQQIQHAYGVSGRACTISRLRKNSSDMHTRYPDGAAGSHGYEISDPTCLQGIRTGLQDLTGSEH